MRFPTASWGRESRSMPPATCSAPRRRPGASSSTCGSEAHPFEARPTAAPYNDAVKRSGVADLPLHGGRVPAWLATRMTTLGTAIAESVIAHYGRSAFLSRLSDPFWFQAYGSVMGMD